MPRNRRQSAQDSRLASIIANYVNQLVSAVRQEVHRQRDEELRGLMRSGTSVGGIVRRAALPARRRVLPCIAPGCNNPSKGPRFHYLCEKHKDAPRKDYEAWRKARQEKAAA